VAQALVARALPGLTLWLCSACASVAENRRLLIDEYADIRGLAHEETRTLG
jgi:hypothetical protein